MALTVAPLCIAGGFAVSTVGRWAYVDQIIAKKVQLRDALYRYSEDEGFPIGAVHSACADGLCREPIEFLRAERLSFFRDEPSLRHGTTPNEKR